MAARRALAGVWRSWPHSAAAARGDAASRDAARDAALDALRHAARCAEGDAALDALRHAARCAEGADLAGGATASAGVGDVLRRLPRGAGGAGAADARVLAHASFTGRAALLPRL